MIIGKHRFQHSERNDLNGVLRYLYNKYGKSKYFDLIEVKSSSKYDDENYLEKKCN